MYFLNPSHYRQYYGVQPAQYYEAPPQYFETAPPQYYETYNPQQHGAYRPQQHQQFNTQYNTHQNIKCPPQRPCPYVVSVPANLQRQISYKIPEKELRYAEVDRDKLNQTFPNIQLETMDLKKLKIHGAANRIFRYFGNRLRRQDQVFILNHLTFQQIEKGNYLWVSSLLMMKAEPYACNFSGQSLLEFAQKYPSHEIVELIQKTKDSFIQNALSDAQIAIQDSLMGSNSQETTELTNEETQSIEDSEVSEIESIQSNGDTQASDKELTNPNNVPNINEIEKLFNTDEIESIQSNEDTQASDEELTSPKNVPNIDQIENLIGTNPLVVSDTLDTSPNSTRAFMSIPSIQEPKIVQEPKQTFEVRNLVYPHKSLNTFSDSFENMMSS